MVGTRPEAIKLAPVARALIERGLVPELLLTGQHPDMEPAAFGFPHLPTRSLACRGLEDPHAQARAVATAALPHLRGARLVLVQGDTSSALGGALAASRAGVPVGHVEAGLRSHDSRSPWPEEDFRVAIDAGATLLFAPTELSAANLRRQRVPGAIHITGNTGIDAALACALPPRVHRSGEAPLRLLVTCHRRESWGEGLASIASALKEISSNGGVHIRLVLHPNPLIASAMRQMLGAVPAVRLCPPMSHREMLQAMRDSDLALSDSGGMQEEAPLLGLPLLVLRDRTERPEAIASGNLELVGTSADGIVTAVRRLVADAPRLAAMRRPAFPYGDGRAATRIADIIVDSLGLPRRSRAA